MNIYNKRQALQELCRLSKKWGMYLGFNLNDSVRGILQAAPYLQNHDEVFQWICDEQAFLLFDTESEMESCFDQTVGDEGPTISNPYKGPARVYALTCDNHGRLRNENT